jgi:ferredoxin
MMALDLFYPRFDVVRNRERCTLCGACISQCANGVHSRVEDGRGMLADSTRCVNCQRCVALCPARALKIVKSDNAVQENANWSGKAIREIYRQAESGGVLLSSMGNPEPYPVYFDRMLLNASQVTNPSIDPLREPMETRVFLGPKPQTISRDALGRIEGRLSPI